MPNASAIVNITVTESGGDVIVSGSGSANTAGLTCYGAIASVGVLPSAGAFAIGGSRPAVMPVTYCSTATTIIPFGSNTVFLQSNAVTGDRFGIISNILMLPDNYPSGTPLIGTSTHYNTTIAGMGMTPGTYTSTWGTGSNADSLVLTIGNPTPSPTVTGVSPASGSTAGGTTVTLTGTDLTGASAITVGGAACTPVSVASGGTSATCTTPAGSAGTASVVVTTAGGSNAANTLFSYVVPPPPAPIPTLSEWAMIFLASLMAMFAFARVRKSKH